MAAFQKHAPAGLREDLSVSLSATSTLVASPLRTKSVVPATKFAFGRHMETDKPTKPVDEKFAWETTLLEDSLTPYRLQGDLSMNSRDNLLKRNALRMDPRVKRAIQMFWDMVPKSVDFQVEKQSYISLLVRVCKLVIPDFDLESAMATAESDWERDAKGNKTMGYRQFFDAFFELADIWCPDIDGGQYAHFLDTLRTRLMVMVVHRKDGSVLRKLVNVMRMSPTNASLLGKDTPSYVPQPIVDPYKSAAARAKDEAPKRDGEDKEDGEARGSAAVASSRRSPSPDLLGAKRGSVSSGGRGLVIKPDSPVKGSAIPKKSPASTRVTKAAVVTQSKKAPVAAATRELKGNPSAEAAATRVQSLARGKFAREKVETIKAAKAAGITDVDKANAAAAKVQAGIRGHRDRKYVEALKEQRFVEDKFGPSQLQSALDARPSTGSAPPRRPVTPRPGDDPDSNVERPAHTASSKRQGPPSRSGNLLDVLAFDTSELQEGDVVTMGFADLDEIYHCPDLIVEEDEEDEDDEDDEPEPPPRKGSKPAVSASAVKASLSMAPTGASVVVAPISRAPIAPAPVTSVPPAVDMPLFTVSGEGSGDSSSAPPEAASSAPSTGGKAASDASTAGGAKAGSSAPLATASAGGPQASGPVVVPGWPSSHDGQSLVGGLPAAGVTGAGQSQSASSGHLASDSAHAALAATSGPGSSAGTSIGAPVAATSHVGVDGTASTAGPHGSSSTAADGSSIQASAHLDQHASSTAPAGSAGHLSVSSAVAGSAASADGSGHGQAGAVPVAGTTAVGAPASAEGSASSQKQQHAAGAPVAGAGTVPGVPTDGSSAQSQHPSAGVSGGVSAHAPASSVSGSTAPGDGSTAHAAQPPHPSGTLGAGAPVSAGGSAPASVGQQQQHLGSSIAGAGGVSAPGSSVAGAPGSTSGPAHAGTSAVSGSAHPAGIQQLEFDAKASADSGDAGAAVAAAAADLLLFDSGAVVAEEASKLGDSLVPSKGKKKKPIRVPDESDEAPAAPVSLREMIGTRMRGKKDGASTPLASLLQSVSLKKMMSGKLKQMRNAAASGVNKDGVPNTASSSGTPIDQLEDDDGGDFVDSDEDAAPPPLPVSTEVYAPRPLFDGTSDPYLADEDVSAIAGRADLQAPRVLIAGKPGAGKSELSQKLSAALSVPVYGLEEVISAAVKAADAPPPVPGSASDVYSALKRALQAEVAHAVSSALPPPQSALMKLLALDLLEAQLVQGGFILDGCPTSSVEFQALDAALLELSNGTVALQDVLPSRVVHLDIGVEDIVIRATTDKPEPAPQPSADGEEDGKGDDGADGAVGEEGKEGDEEGKQSGGDEEAIGGKKAGKGSLGAPKRPKFSELSPEQQGIEIQRIRDTVVAYNEDSLIADKQAHIVVDACQSSEDVFREVLELLAEGAPPLSRLAAPPPVAHPITIPADVLSADSGPASALQYLLYAKLPELVKPASDAVEPSGGDVGEGDAPAADAESAGPKLPPDVLKRTQGDVEKRSELEAARAGNRSLSSFGTKCPVSLLDGGVVVDGSTTVPAEYMGQVYLFANPEARDRFIRNPKRYLVNRPKPPSTSKVAIVPVAAPGEGDARTSVGAALAAILGLPFVDCVNADKSHLAQDIADSVKFVVSKVDGPSAAGGAGGHAPAAILASGAALSHAGSVSAGVGIVQPGAGHPSVAGQAPSSHPASAEHAQSGHVGGQSAASHPAVLPAGHSADGQAASGHTAAADASHSGQPGSVDHAQAGHSATGSAGAASSSVQHAGSTSALLGLPGAPGVSNPLSRAVSLPLGHTATPGWLLTNAPESTEVWQQIIAQGVLPDTVVLVRSRAVVADAKAASDAAAKAKEAAAGEIGDAAVGEDGEPLAASADGADGADGADSADGAAGESGDAPAIASIDGSSPAVDGATGHSGKPSAVSSAIVPEFDENGLPPFAAALKKLLEAHNVKVTVIDAPDAGAVDDKSIAAVVQRELDPFAPSSELIAPGPDAVQLPGDMGNYCPVTSLESGVLVPGDPSLTVRVSGERYCFKDEAAKRKFESNPLLYLHLPTEAAVIAGTVPSLDSPRPLPPPRILVLAPHGSGVEEHLAALSKQLGVEIISVPQQVAAHPKWGTFLEERAARAAASAAARAAAEEAGEEYIEEAGEGGEGEGGDSNSLPAQAYADAIKDSYKRSLRALVKGSFLDGLADVITPELAAELLAKGAPPSIVIPVTFDAQKLVDSRLKSEFVYTRPAVPVRGEEEEEEEEEQGAEPPPTAAELAAQEQEAKEEARAKLAEAVDADKQRLGDVEKVFETAGVAIANPVNFTGANPARILARLAAVIEPIINQTCQPIVNAAPVPPAAAEAMLDSGSKRLSKFGPYCPVTLKETGELTASLDHPVVYRRHVYMLSDAAAVKKFVANPAAYVSQPPPPPALPPTCVIIGPEFSGRSSAARAVAEANNMSLVSVGSAVEALLAPTAPDTALRRQVQEALNKGGAISDTLAAEAVARFVRGASCAKGGWVLDGFPSTPSQAAALQAAGIVPRTVFALRVPEPELFARAQAAAEAENGRFGLGLGPDVYTAGQKKVRAIPRKKKAAPKGDEDGKLGGEDGEEAAGGDEGEQGEEGEQEEAEEGGEGEEEGAAPPAQFGLGPAIVRPGDWIDVHSKVKAGLLDPNDLIAARAPNTGGHIPTAPELGNASVIARKIGREQAAINQVVDGYLETFENVKSIDASGSASRWAVAQSIAKQVKEATKHAREYARALAAGRPAPIQDVVFSREELKAKESPYGSYCPVSWATQKKLVNLSGNPAQRSYGVEYKGKVYYPAGPEEAALFLKDPEQVLSGEPFPAPAKLPLRLLPADVLECGGKLALKGFCPVSLLENPESSQFIVGNDSLPVLYRNRVFFFETEDKLRRFMQTPMKYATQRLPAKVPPKLSRVAPQRLADGSAPAGSIGYLEQTLSEMIVKSLTAVEQHRTALAHPALSIPASCQAFVALHLKANNAAAPSHIRARAAARLQQFLDECSLAEKIKGVASQGSGARAARLSPRITEAAALGEQFDKLKQEPKQLLATRFLRPDPVPGK